MQEAIDSAGKAFLAGRRPEHQRALEEAVGVATYRHLSASKLAEPLRAYTVKADLGSGIGAEVLRNPAVRSWMEGQTLFGGKPELQKRFEELTSKWTLAGSMPPASRQVMEDALAGYNSQPMLAGITSITPRALESFGVGAISDSQLAQIVSDRLSAHLPTTLSPQLRNLASEISGNSRLVGLSAISSVGAKAFGPELLASRYREWVSRNGFGDSSAAFKEWALSSGSIDAFAGVKGLTPFLSELTLGELKPLRSALLDAAPETLLKPEVLPPLGRGDQLVPFPYSPWLDDEDLAPVVAGRSAARDREMVLTLLEEAELEEEREHLEALEERLRAGHAPARNHAAVSARQLLLGVANHCFPAQSESRRCRLGCPHCPHPLGSQEVMNRIIAFVDDRLAGKVEPQEFKLFLAQASYVYRWGGRGTHQNLSAPEAVKAFVRLLEVLAMVARAYGVQQPPGLPA